MFELFIRPTCGALRATTLTFRVDLICAKFPTAIVVTQYTTLHRYIVVQARMTYLQETGFPWTFHSYRLFGITVTRNSTFS